MKTWTITTVTLAMLGLSAGTARADHCRYTSMVEGWYAHYLGRPLDPAGFRAWVPELRCGRPVLEVEAGILGSEEYYRRRNYCPYEFVTGLYLDILGRQPCRHEVEQWVCQLRRCGCRATLAKSFLLAAQVELARRAYTPVAPPAYQPPQRYEPAPRYEAPRYEPIPRYVPEPPAYQPNRSYSPRPAREIAPGIRISIRFGR